jgi:plasmid stabilization system protein ParE
VFDYISQDSPAAAERVVRAIRNTAASLGDQPFLGAVYSSAGGTETRELLCEKYRIFYRVVERSKRINIVTVRHSARREPRL